MRYGSLTKAHTHTDIIIQHNASIRPRRASRVAMLLQPLMLSFVRGGRAEEGEDERDAAAHGLGAVENGGAGGVETFGGG